MALTSQQKRMLRSARVGAYQLEDRGKLPEARAVMRLVRAFETQHVRAAQLYADNMKLQEEKRSTI